MPWIHVPASVRARESAVPKLKPKPPSLAAAATLPKAPPAVENRNLVDLHQH